MYEMKRMAASLKEATLDEVAGTGSGYLAVFNNVDGQKDAILPGAFTKSIAQLEQARKQRKGRYLLVILWQHQPDQPIGGITSLTEDSHGLRIDFELDMSIENGRRAYSSLKRGYIGGFSIGYRTVKDEMRQDGVRLLKEVSLIEGSVVTFPANDMAVVDQNSMKRDLSLQDEMGALVFAMKGALANYEKRGAYMGNRNYGQPLSDYGNIQNPLVGTSETPSGFGYEPGDPMESRALFEAELRRERREADPELGLLEPGGKQWRKVTEQRAKAKEEKLRKMREAYEQEKREAEAHRQAWLKHETLCPEDFAELTGHDLAWARSWFDQAIRTGFVTAVNRETLEISRGDLSRLMRRDSEELERRAISLRHKRLAQAA